MCNAGNPCISLVRSKYNQELKQNIRRAVYTFQLHTLLLCLFRKAVEWQVTIPIVDDVSFSDKAPLLETLEFFEISHDSYQPLNFLPL